MRSSLLILIVLAATAFPAAAANRKPHAKPGATPASIAALPVSTADHNVNEVLTTVTDVGAFGYFDPQAGISAGQGFVFDGSPSTLFHGGVVMGTGPTMVSDAAYGSDDNGDTRPFNFVSTEAITTGSEAAIDQYTCSKYRDTEFDVASLGVEVEQSTYAWAGDSYIVIDLMVTATNALNGLYVGFYTDWDLGTTVTSEDTVIFDAARRLSFVQDTPVTGTVMDPHVYGIQLLSHPLSGARAVNNTVYVYPDQSGGTVDPGFQDSDKYAFFSDMVVTSMPAPDDVSLLIAAGPFNLAAAGSVRVAFAMLGGVNPADITAQADGAQARWNAGIDSPCTRTVGVHDGPISISTQLAQNHPNPFTGSTTIEYALDKPGNVQLRVYDISGKMVRELVSGHQEAASHRVTWDGRGATGNQLSAGIYFCELVGPGVQASRRMVLGR